MVHSISPMDTLRYRGIQLSSLSDADVEEVLGNYPTFKELLAEFKFQYDYKIYKKCFLFRWYLELVVKDWLNPTNKEIKEDISCMFFT